MLWDIGARPRRTTTAMTITFDREPIVTDAWIDGCFVYIEAKGEATDSFDGHTVYTSGIATLDADEFLEALDITTEQLSTADFLAQGVTIEQAEQALSWATQFDFD